MLRAKPGVRALGVGLSRLSAGQARGWAQLASGQLQMSPVSPDPQEDCVRPVKPHPHVQPGKQGVKGILSVRAVGTEQDDEKSKEFP